MTTLRSVAIWLGITLISVVSAVCWLVAVVAIMLWPLPAFAILTVAAVTSLAAMHIAQVRVDAVSRKNLRERGNDPPPAALPAGKEQDDPLREILGDEMFRELSALGAASD